MSLSQSTPILSLTDIETLLASMTLEEKAGQLNQPPNIDEISDEDIRSGRIGSVICAYNAFAGNEKHERVRTERINDLQRMAVEQSRTGIPIIFARDVIHGYRTVAPIPLGQAASFSPEHVQAVQEVAALEARADGIHWTFSPMLDIGRDPRWGRVAEGYGEDPYLASVLGVAAIKGLQGDDISRPDKMAACFKHFAGYGAAEGGRDYNTGEITEYTFRNLYLRPFHAAAKAGVATGMAAFLETGGEPATCNSWLLDQVLRKEWGWNGVIVSDWNAVHEIVCHGRAVDDKEATTLALPAGTDIDMASFAYVAYIPELVRAGLLDEEVVNEAVRRVLTLKFKLGLFAEPYADQTRSESCQFTPQNQATTLELARRSMVLLKNEGAHLPLASGKRVLLYGGLAKARHQLFGTWTLDGEESDVVTIADALKGMLPSGTELVEAPFIDDATNLGRLCDLAVVVIGETPSRSGENQCIAELGLPAGQLEQVQALRRVGIPVVAVVLTGRALDLSALEKECDGILLAFHPGVMGGIAIAETLVGRNNPSGKLPVTFPRHAGQVPLYYNRKETGRPTNPQIRAESRYTDNWDCPLYPFGYGLSYSQFEYGEPSYENWTVSVSVTNSGDRDAEEVVQLYLRDEVARKVRPVRELIRFQRISLRAGETRVVTFTLSPDDLGYYGKDNTWVVEPGWFSLAVGSDSDCPMFTRFELN